MSSAPYPRRPRKPRWGTLGVTLAAMAALTAWLLCGPRKPAAPPPQWEPQPVETDAKFRGLCVVSADVVWASGTGGTFVRTTDGGTTWAVGTVPYAADLDFRDVEAFGPDTAYLLAAGEGPKSRIYKTTDGGKTWALQFKNADPAGFFDALAFWDERHGIALGDPVNGKFQLIQTSDGGASWTPLAAALPPALPEEGAFAASGTCLVAHGANDVWFATGGPNGARVFRSADRGRNWAVSEAPVAAGSKSAGVFSLALRDREHGIAVGGDYTRPEEAGAHVAVTDDGGKTWALTLQPLPYRSCVAWANDRWVAVGPSGSDVSHDGGQTWERVDDGSYNSAAFAADGTGWAVGPDGRVAKWVK